MSYVFIPENRYRMPTHFGPSLGPRQGVGGRRYSNTETPRALSAQARFEVDKQYIEKLMPPGFKVREPYSLSITFEYITDVEWLAGRGYNTFGVSTPATYTGEKEVIHGNLLLILWENMADPIVTGREELGYAKMFCDIHPPKSIENNLVCRASWDGWEFACLEINKLKPILSQNLPAQPPSEGTLHYKYIPKTGVAGDSDASYAVLTPPEWPNMKCESPRQAASAVIKFHNSTWEQLPTLVNIVNTFAAIEYGPLMSATVMELKGGKDLSDQRIVL